MQKINISKGGEKGIKTAVPLKTQNKGEKYAEYNH